jgi:lysophospholipase L1-like esterase
VASAFERLAVPDGEHVLELVVQRGVVRAFGVVLERQQPGVVLDALGVQGARIRLLDKQDDQHWAEQLARRRPDLLVFHFGANESGDGVAYPMAAYQSTMKEVLLQARRATPGASCLVLAAMDRGRKLASGTITEPVIPRIVAEQERTAREVGCAFWNKFMAMGGRGSMARWVRRGLGQADLTHPSIAGADLLGNWIFQALMRGFDDYLARAPESAAGLQRE